MANIEIAKTNPIYLNNAILNNTLGYCSLKYLSFISRKYAIVLNNYIVKTFGSQLKLIIIYIKHSIAK